MRYFLALTAFLAIAALSPAAAQIYPGQDVTVNTSAAGTQVLLYPGGQYVRIVPALRQPGQDDGPIHLHMPYRHHVARSVPRPPTAVAAVAPPIVAPEQTAAPAPVRTEAPVRVRKAAPARVRAPAPAPEPQSTQASNLSNLNDVESLAPATPAPVKPTPPKAERKPAPQRVANIEPPRPAAPRNPDDFGTKRTAVLFAAGASDPSAPAVGSVKSLAGELNSAMGDGSSRVQLVAYGGQRGEKSSDTRRLSLKRALVIRQLLIDDGVPSERIDVRAMGGADDSGPLDRVDVFLKG